MAGSGSHLPLAALLLAAAVLAATSAVPAAAAKYGGRMVIIHHAPGSSSRAVVSAGGALNNKWRQPQPRRRLVEDEVAPEFGSGLLGLGAGNGGHVSSGALIPDRAVCLPNAQCAAKGPRGSYTRPCTYKDRCPHTPAGHARARVHV